MIAIYLNISACIFCLNAERSDAGSMVKRVGVSERIGVEVGVELDVGIELVKEDNCSALRKKGLWSKKTGLSSRYRRVELGVVHVRCTRGANRIDSLARRRGGAVRKVMELELVWDDFRGQSVSRDLCDNDYHGGDGGDEGGDNNDHGGSSDERVDTTTGKKKQW